MSLLFSKSGILSTVQDLGRFGYRRFGINPGGVMDLRAARLINILLGNDEGVPVVEMHYPAAEITFEKPCSFAVGGARFSAELDGLALDNWRIYSAEKGACIRFRDKLAGNRVYIAVRGGLDAEHWLGSYATNLPAERGGSNGRAIAPGDRLGFRRPDVVLAPTPRGQMISASLIPHYSVFPTVRIVAGAEYERLNPESRLVLERQNFSVSTTSNRMGFRLEGKPLRLEDPVELVSSAVTFGTIQLLPDGQMIALMADHQTAGGYPRIAHVIGHDLPVLAQLGALDQIAFHMVTLAEAESLSYAFEQDLAYFRAGRRLQVSD